jgi:hypothetical protein
MKNLISPAIVFFLAWGLHANTLKIPLQVKGQQVFPALTNDDRKNFILHIDQKQIRKPTSDGTKEFPSNQLNFGFDLTLINNSHDTLKYLMNYISWSDIFKADNPYLHIYKAYVGNNPNPARVEILAPHNSRIFKIPINYNKTKMNSGSSFRIAMGIFKYTTRVQLTKFNPSTTFNLSDTTNVIWSNKVAIP